MSSLLYQIEMLARQDQDVAKIRAMLKAAARVLTEKGHPTRVVFGPSTASRPKGAPKPPTPGRKKLRRKQDGQVTIAGVYDESFDAINDEGDFESAADAGIN
jgi:hypothetical protein